MCVFIRVNPSADRPWAMVERAGVPPACQLWGRITAGFILLPRPIIARNNTTGREGLVSDGLKDAEIMFFVENSVEICRSVQLNKNRSGSIPQSTRVVTSIHARGKDEHASAAILGSEQLFRDRSSRTPNLPQPPKSPTFTQLNSKGHLSARQGGFPRPYTPY
jgi:hypothetical protein